MQKDPFVEIMKAEFARKCARNSRYSLRSFSRDLGLDASNLSKLLSYKKPLGETLKKKIAGKMGFEHADMTLFASPSSTNTLDKAYRSHLLEQFNVIAGWQHYAILELFKLKGFKPTLDFIQSRLGLDRKTSTASLERLKKVGLIKRNAKSGHLAPVDESSSSILKVATSKAHREQQREILEGAISALENTAPDLRSQSSMTMAIDPTRLEDARKLTKKFRRQMGRLLSSSAELTEVYQLSVSLYPITLPSPQNKGDL